MTSRTDRQAGKSNLQATIKMTNTTQQGWPDTEIRAELAQLRQTQPLVHCMTNLVVTGFTANVLLAIGAAPAMIIAREESADFACIASSLLINLGTITADSADAMLVAVKAAREAGTPWVLDPVAVGVLSFRQQICGRLLGYHPSIIRGNASEILALAGVASGRGVDSTAASSQAIEAAMRLACQTGAVVAVSGATDYLTDGQQMIEVSGGREIMTRVTGTGCALGAVMAAFLGAGVAPLRAATAASAIFAQAAERAAEQAKGPASFSVGFIDQLSLLA